MIKSFIIRLKDNEHSCKMAKDCFDQAKNNGLDPEYFDAINGIDFKHHYQETGILPLKKLKKGRLGVLGCFFSHYYLWKKSIELNEPLIILEHDGFILKPIEDNILDKFEDVLKLDRLDPYSGSYNSNLELEKNLELSIKKYINPTPKNPEKLGTGNYFKGAYAYIIKPHAAQKILDHIAENGHVTADQQIGDWIVDTRTTIPSLARLHPFYSIGNNIKTHSLTQGLENNI